MPFKPGESGNPSGRPKGSPNKASLEIKEMIERMITDNAKSLQHDFKALKGKDKINAMATLLPYVVPKLQSTSLDIDIERLSDDQLDELYNRIVNTANSKT